MRIELSRILAIALLIASWGERATAQVAAAPALEGTAWKLATLPDVELVSAASSTVTFGPAGALTGSDGCNRYRGTWTESGGTLTMTPGGATMMACPEPIMKQAGAFTAALAATRTYAMDAGQLVLTGANGERLATFIPLPVAALQGTAWHATAVNNGKEAVVSLVNDSVITATFSADGKLSGSGGCNRYKSTYTLDGEGITIAPPAATRKRCPGKGVMEQEQHFFAAIARATTIQLGENTLELRDAAGALQVSFRAERSPSKGR